MGQKPTYEELEAVVAAQEQEKRDLQRRIESLSDQIAQLKALQSPKSKGKPKDTALKALYRDRNYFAALEFITHCTLRISLAPEISARVQKFTLSECCLPILPARRTGFADNR